MNYKAFAKKMSTHSILHIEDDNDTSGHLSKFLSSYCKNLYSCNNSEKGLEIYNKHSPDILLVDVKFPWMDVINFIISVREYDHKTRIVILTAYTNHDFMIKAIELELTRCLVKPINNENLLLALEKCVNELDNNNIVNIGNGNIYSKRLASIINNTKRIPLRKKEIDLLEFFIDHDGEIIDYDRLEMCVWDNEVVSRDTIRSQIRNIRQKIGQNCLENIMGVGYRFKVNSSN